MACRNASFFEFSLCLSRACLGKMIIFIYTLMAQKDAFLEATRPYRIVEMFWNFHGISNGMLP